MSIAPEFEAILKKLPKEKEKKGVKLDPRIPNVHFSAEEIKERAKTKKKSEAEIIKEIDAVKGKLLAKFEEDRQNREKGDADFDRMVA